MHLLLAGNSFRLYKKSTLEIVDFRIVCAIRINLDVMQIFYTTTIIWKYIEKTRQYLLCCWFNNPSKTDNRIKSMHGIEYTGREHK